MCRRWLTGAGTRATEADGEEDGLARPIFRFSRYFCDKTGIDPEQE